MARSAIGSIKARINKVDRAIAKKKVKAAKKAEKDRLMKALAAKRNLLSKMR